MKKILILLFFAFTFVLNVFANSIDYGYNARGEYVPKSIGNERIDYGYNAKGEYVPTSIGGKRIDYGYNAHGDYVPKSIGN